MAQVSRPQVPSSSELRVSPDDLADSAQRIDRLVGDLRTTHAAAHERMDGAQAGQVGNSGLALKALLTKWQSDTTTLVDQLTKHGQAFQSAATAYRDTDARFACAIKAAGDEASPDTRL